MARDLNKIPTIDELRIALEKCGHSIRPYDMVLLNNYLESLTIEDQGNANIVKYLNIGELPDVGDNDTLYVITNDSLLYVWNNGSYLQMSGGGGTTTTWGDIIGNILNQQDLAMVLNNKVDKVSGKQLSSEDFTGTEKSKLSGIEQGAQVNPSASQIKASYESNANTNAYTDAEKNKLASAITSETDPTVPSWAKQSTKPAYTKGEVGLANVDNIQQATKSEFISHDSDSVRHITSAERDAWNASAGTGLTLGETSTTAYRGDYGKTAYDHSQSAHAPINAQKNSDITKAEIEAKLTGPITTHTHSIEEISDLPEKDNLIAGSNISITKSGNNITISSTGGDGGGSAYINVEEEVTVTGGDISGNMINITLTQTPVIAERFDVFLNGLLVPRSLLSITGTSLSIDLTILNMLPVIGDFLSIKYSM